MVNKFILNVETKGLDKAKKELEHINSILDQIIAKTKELKKSGVNLEIFATVTESEPEIIKIKHKMK